MPIKNAIQLTNLVYNSSVENGNTSGLANNSTYDGYWTIAALATGGMFGNYFTRTTATTAQSSVGGRGYYLNRQFNTTVGSTFTVSYYVRPSVAMTFRAGIEQRSSTNVGLASVVGTETLCPPGVWTRVTGVLTTNAPTVALIRPTFYGAANSAYPIAIGDYFDMDGFMVTETSFLPDYRDASFPGWSWSGTAYSSVQTGPYFVDKPIKVRYNLVNQVPRPNFSSQYGGYQSGTSAGSRVYGTNELTLTATTLAGSTRRFGISVGNAWPAVLSGSSATVFKANEWYITIRGKVDTSAMVAGTRAQFYIDIVNGYSYVSSRTVNVDAGATEFLHHSLLTTDLTQLQQFFWLTANPNVDWSGTSVIKMKEFMVVLTREDISPAYFDGDMVGCSWAATAGSSKSLNPQWKDAVIKRFDGTSWVAT